MSEEIEKLIKIQGILNKNKFHLVVETDLETKAEWYLYQVFADFDAYMSNDNRAILESKIDSIDTLISYLEQHNGFRVKF